MGGAGATAQVLTGKTEGHATCVRHRCHSRHRPTAGTYFINQRAKANELKIEARGIARVAERDLRDAATALALYKAGEEDEVPKDFWTPIAANDLQNLASNLTVGEWRRFGCAAKKADAIRAELRSGPVPRRSRWTKRSTPSGEVPLL